MGESKKGTVDSELLLLLLLLFLVTSFRPKEAVEKSRHKDTDVEGYSKLFHRPFTLANQLW